jgi:hypothetical protein
MFNLEQSLGKTIEIKIEEDDDNVIYEQVIFAIIGSVTITNYFTRLCFGFPIQVSGDYVIDKQDLATVHGDTLTLFVGFDRDGEEYGTGVKGKILKIY